MLEVREVEEERWDSGYCMGLRENYHGYMSTQCGLPCLLAHLWCGCVGRVTYVTNIIATKLPSQHMPSHPEAPQYLYVWCNR